MAIKSKQIHPIRKLTDDEPGQHAWIDQMVSAQPGLILNQWIHNLCGSFLGPCVCLLDERSDSCRNVVSKTCL